MAMFEGGLLFHDKQSVLTQAHMADGGVVREIFNEDTFPKGFLRS